MIEKLYLRSIARCLVLVSCSSFGMNILRPYDVMIRPPLKKGSMIQTAFIAEHGFNDHGYNACGDRVNVLQIWNCDQDALKMLEGFDATSPQGLLAIKLRADGANDDGVRGHFIVTGDLHTDSFAITSHYNFLDAWFFTAYLPIYNMTLKNVQWKNETLDVSSGDQSVKTNLTNNFFSNVAALGDGLYLGDWSRTGIGDLVLMMDWAKDFYQYKPLLKNTRVNWRIGFNLPTGLREDENKIFARPFGFDGAFGLIFGFGLELTYGCYVKLGGDVELTQLFGNTRCRRIKTDIEQTELLLLAKTQAYRNYGLQQRFNLWGQLFNVGGFGLKVGYQYLKRGEDSFALRTPEFSTNIANTARSLESWTVHNAIVDATYDFSVHLDQCTPVKPYVSLFSRVPFNGDRSAAGPTIGGLIALDF